MSHYIKVEKEVALYVEDLGEGTPIVCIHGWPLNQKMFEYQMEVILKKGYRFIGIDLRGFGKSDHPLEGYAYDRMADDIRTVIDKLQLQSIVLLGFSMGGAITIRYMAHHQGHNVKKLILCGAAAPSFVQRPNYPYGMTKEAVNELIKGIYENRPKALHDFSELFFSGPVNDYLKQWSYSLGLEASSHGVIETAKSLRDEDLRQDLAKIKVPTAIFHGVHDKVCPFDFAKVMHEGIKNSKLIPFENSGHGLFIEERVKMNRELMKFIGS